MHKSRDISTTRISSDIPQKTNSYFSVRLSEVIHTGSSCEYVWLDTNIKNHRILREKLSTLDEHIHIFNALSECEKFVKEMLNVNIVLILAVNYYRQIIQDIHHLVHLQAINVYDADEEDDERLWTKTFPKTHFFLNVNDLIHKCFVHPRLVTDTHEPALFHLYSREKTFNSTKADDMLWLPALLCTLNRIDNDHNGKSQFIRTCQTIYKTNKRNLEVLDEFEQTYARETVINWYTKNCFLFRLLNKVLREQNVEGILLFRFFITDLHQMIEKIFCSGARIEISGGPGKFTKHTIRDHGNYLPIERVYRGQIMTKHELETLQKHDKRRLYFNSFLSATEDRDLALLFAGARSNSLTSNTQSVVFEIELLNKDINDPRPYAKISDFSSIQDEKEILFTLGSIFDINDIIFDKIESSWFIKMEPASELVQQLYPQHLCYFSLPEESLSIDYETESRLLGVGRLLQYIPNDDEKTNSDIKCYYSLLRSYIPNNFSVAAAYAGIGILKFYQRHFTRCIKYLRKALKLYNEILAIEIFYSKPNMIEIGRLRVTYYHEILCTIYKHIISSCLFIRVNVEDMNRWCVQFASIGFLEGQRGSVSYYVSIARCLKMLGYFQSVAKLTTSLKMYELSIVNNFPFDYVIRGNGWTIMEAIIHVDIDDWDFFTKMKQNERYLEHLLATDRCENVIQRILHGTLIVCLCIANLYRKKRRMDLALIWYNMIIANIEDDFIPVYYSIIGEGFVESNEQHHALEYYDRAIDYWKTTQDKKYQDTSSSSLVKEVSMRHCIRTVVDETVRLPHYPFSCLIKYDVPPCSKRGDIIDAHRNAYKYNFFYTVKIREWSSILGAEFCMHTSHIHANLHGFNMAVHWCRQAFELWPEPYRYHLLTSKIDGLLPTLNDRLIVLMQRSCRKQAQ